MVSRQITLWLLLCILVVSCFGQNPEPRVVELQARARGGDVDAMLELSECFAEGKGVTRNLKHAYRCVEIAADKGSAKARYRLSRLLREVVDIAKNE